MNKEFEQNITNWRTINAQNLEDLKVRKFTVVTEVGGIDFMYDSETGVIRHMIPSTRNTTADLKYRLKLATEIEEFLQKKLDRFTV